MTTYISLLNSSLLTSKNTADRIGIADQTLRVSRKTGLLLGASAPKHIKMGRIVRYRAEELENWLAQFEAEAEKEGM
jgi:predicted DNA-binding transcriptional regulator AlpA